MFQCDVCGGRESRTETVSEVFTVQGKRVLVENIPVQVCVQCGEMTFNRETTERVRRMVHDEAELIGVVELGRCKKLNPQITKRVQRLSGRSTLPKKDSKTWNGLRHICLRVAAGCHFSSPCVADAPRRMKI